MTRRILSAAFIFYLFGFKAAFAWQLMMSSTVSASSIVGLSPLVDNFNDGQDPNFWGGNKGTFASAVGGETISADYDAANAYGGSGYALRIAYGVPNAASYAGCAIDLAPSGNSNSAATYKALSFLVKADRVNQSFKIEMKNANSRNASLYVTDILDGGLTTDWKKVEIPLDAFVDLDSLANVTQLVLVFEHDYESHNNFLSSGTVYIDNVQFETSTMPVRIDPFGDNWDTNALGGNVGDLSGNGGSHSHSYSSSTYHLYPRSLFSQYNVTTGYAGLFFLFGSTGFAHDFSAYHQLSVSLEANTANDNPGQVKIELVDSSGIHSALIPDDTATPGIPISTNWQTYTIPLANFSGLDKSSIKQMNIIYEDWRAANKIGRVYYDEIQFE